MKKYLRVQRSLFFTILLAVSSKAVIAADTQDKKVAGQEKNISKKKVKARDTAILEAKEEALAEEFVSNKKDEKADIRAKKKELLKLELENSLIRLRLEHELANLRAEIEKLRTEREMFSLKWDIEQEKNKKENQRAVEFLNQQRDKIIAELSLSQAQFSKTLEDFNKQYAHVQNELSLARAHVDHLRLEVDTKKAQQERSGYAEGGASYLDEPLQKDGKLIISDRKINLTGVISPWKANYIVDQISYFNNKDTQKPIFLVIDNSPGGSAYSGFQILQAMKNSQAPVHVVVQSYAASMAALITTLAKKSYIYPNAVILHHLPWTSVWYCNVREMKEVLDWMQQIWARFGGEVAKKMGIRLEELDKKFYEKSVSGNWEEFGDNATKIKWADHVITHMYDTGLRQQVDSRDYTWYRYYQEYYDQGLPLGENGKINSSQGKIWLPPLAANDFYYLYNPNNVYQIIGSEK